MNIFLWPISAWLASMPRKCAKCTSWKLTGQVAKGDYNDPASFDEDGKRECWTVGKCSLTGETVKGSATCAEHSLREV